MTSTKAEALFVAIDVGLSSRNITTNRLKCVSFDGAAVMSSADKGLYGLMKCNWNLPHLIYQHCRAHRFQLVSKAVSKDFPVVEDSIAGLQVLFTFFHRSNKKYELLKEQTAQNPTAQGRFKGLMGVANTRWLSHSGAIARALDILSSVALTLDCISESPNFDATDRSTAAGLFSKLVCIEKIKILVYMDYILDKLAHLSVKFQSSTMTTSDAIRHTSVVIRELHDGTNPIAVKAVINDRSSIVIRDLEEVGIEIINTPIRRKARSEKCEVEDTLAEYTKALELEMLRRFGEDTQLLASMVAFTHQTWSVNKARVAFAFGFDETKLLNESVSLERHCELSTAISDVDCTPKGTANFWIQFVSDSYTRQMYSEHAQIAALMLTMPIGSCSVERCFSYSTRIGGDDKRKSLTPAHVQQLVRISQQGPEQPAISDITWPFIICETGIWSEQEILINAFIDKVYRKWLDNPRRIL